MRFSSFSFYTYEYIYECIWFLLCSSGGGGGGGGCRLCQSDCKWRKKFLLFFINLKVFKMFMGEDWENHENKNFLVKDFVSSIAYWSALTNIDIHTTTTTAAAAATTTTTTTTTTKNTGNLPQKILLGSHGCEVGMVGIRWGRNREQTKGWDRCCSEQQHQCY